MGTAVGWHFDSKNHVVHGWVRSKGGRFTQIDDPSAVLATNPNGISDDGLIVGAYVDAAGHMHGFIDDHRTFKTLDFPGVAGQELSAGRQPDPSSYPVAVYRGSPGLYSVYVRSTDGAVTR